MTTQNGRPLRTARDTATTLVVATIPRGYVNASDLQEQRRASRDLDQLCGVVRPGHVCTCPDHWSDVGLSLGMTERDFAARDLAGVAV